MFNPPYFLGLDFGTSGARACVIDANKSVVWQQRFAYLTPATQTPEDWRTALHTLLNALPQPLSSQLQGIAIDGTSGTVLLCDAQAAPVSPALLYNDARAQEEALHLRAIAPADSTVATATSGLAKFLWLTEHYPGAHYFLHQADWLTAQLSGIIDVSDYHNALKSGYDVENLCWPDWLQALPHAALLPHVVAPGEIIGTIQAQVAARFGIARDCAIHAGTTDSIAAFMASGVHESGIGVTSLGTTLVLKQLSKQRIEAPEYGIYSHRYGELWLVGGASNAGAGVLRAYFDDAQLAALSARIDPLRDSPLDYYPLPKTGERFPVNDANLAPRLSPRPADDGEFLHGLLQGLARIEAAGYAKLAALGAAPITRVVSNGGGAKNRVWQQMRARILGVPVTISNHAQAACGAALLAATCGRTDGRSCG